MLSLDSRWYDALAKADFSPVFYLEIELPGGGSKIAASAQWVDYSLTSGPVGSSISSIDQVGTSLDPVTRKTSIDSVSVILLDDEWVREIVDDEGNITGYFAKISMGYYGRPGALVDPIMLFRGRIRKAFATGDGSIHLSIDDQFSELLNSSISGYATGWHPLEMLGLVLLDADGSEDWHDSSAFNRASAIAADGTEHLGVTYAGRAEWHSNPGIEPQAGTGRPYEQNYSTEIIDQNMGQYVDDLLLMLGGLLRPNQDGKLVYHHREGDEAADRHLTTDEYFDLDGSQDAILYNQAKVGFSGIQSKIQHLNGVDSPTGAISELNEDLAWTEEDATSISNRGLVSFEHMFSLHKPIVIGTLTEGSPGVFTIVIHFKFYGLAGTTEPNIYDIYAPFGTTERANSGSLEDWRHLSASNPGYFMIWRERGRTDLVSLLGGVVVPHLNMKEFIKVEASPDTVYSPLVAVDDGYNDFYWYEFNSYQTITRKVKLPPGLSYANQIANDTVGGVTTTEVFILDMTACELIASRIVDRFSGGAEVIRFKTDVSHVDLEVGDYVSLESDWFMSGKLNGLTDKDIFEITKKSVELFSDPPGISWEATFVRTDP